VGCSALSQLSDSDSYSARDVFSHVVEEHGALSSCHFLLLEERYSQQVSASRKTCRNGSDRLSALTHRPQAFHTFTDRWVCGEETRRVFANVFDGVDDIEMLHGTVRRTAFIRTKRNCRCVQ